MVTQTRRLAMATAMLWFGFGGGGRAEASPALTTPAGLSSGDHFRFVFVTDGSRDATSSNINDYNTFVTEQAGGAIYNGKPITWVAIASTPTVNATDNVGLTQDPVYLADGTKVTTSTTTSGLWSGGLLHAIDEDLTGKQSSLRYVWTGTNPTGSTASAQSLGSTSVSYLLTDPPTPVPMSSIFGLSGPPHLDLSWVLAGSFDTNNRLNSLYGISADLIVPQTVVPEPSSLWVVGTLTSAGLASGWSRHRRDQRRQRPVGPPDATLRHSRSPGRGVPSSSGCLCFHHPAEIISRQHPRQRDTRQPPRWLNPGRENGSTARRG